MAFQRVGGVALWRALARFSRRGRLQLLEAGVGELGDLVVVAGEDDGVAGEVSRVAVVVQVVDVGEEQRRVAGVDLGPRRLPGPSSPSAKVRISSAAPVRSRKLSSSRAVRPLNQRLGEESSRVR